MPGYVVVGTQWGDEGKGKIVDILSEKADMIVRFQGGNNAGHTIVVNGEKHILHLLPSGCLHTHASCIVASGVVVDPFVLLEELHVLEEKGLPTNHIYISERAHLLMPYHIALDKLQEIYAKGKKIGTTKRGIGPCYADKFNRVGLRMHDLVHFEQFKEKLRYIIDMKNEIIVNVYHGAPFDYDELVDQFDKIRFKILPRIIETLQPINKALRQNKMVLFEGAQAAMLDIDYGTYPYVTSSSPTAAGVCNGAGISVHSLHRIIGVMKAYATRVGEGPMIGELFDEQGAHIQIKGAEYGATTGRKRRCGWLDLLVIKHAVMINGLTDLVITKLDVLSGLKEIKICIGYEINRQIYHHIPAAIEEIEQATPIYQTFKGWQKDISQITTYEELPKECKDYIKFIEDFINVPVALISVGPDRKHNIILHDLIKPYIV